MATNHFVDDLATSLCARLDAAGIPTYDGEPVTTPGPRPYCVLADDPATARQQSVAYTTRKQWTGQLKYVAHTKRGLRAAVEAGRAALTGWRPFGNHPIVEIGAGQTLIDGPPGDRRASMTVIIRTYF